MTPTTTYEPSDAEIDQFDRALHAGVREFVSHKAIRWILQRFEPRTKGQRCDGSGGLYNIHGDRFVCPGCPACTPKATPKGDGSHASDGVSEAEQSTPGSLIHDEIDNAMCLVTPESMSLLEHHCSDADFATIGKLRDESYAAGYQAGRDDAVRLNVKQVSHVVELGSETLRAVVAAQLMGGLFSLDDDEIEAYRHGAKTPDHEWAAAFAVSAANALLTHLREKETK